MMSIVPSMALFLSEPKPKYRMHIRRRSSVNDALRLDLGVKMLNELVFQLPTIKSKDLAFCRWTVQLQDWACGCYPP
jgi:hypothetical protein